MRGRFCEISAPGAVFNPPAPPLVSRHESSTWLPNHLDIFNCVLKNSEVRRLHIFLQAAILLSLFYTCINGNISIDTGQGGF